MPHNFLVLLTTLALADSGTRLTATVDAPDEATADGDTALIEVTGELVSTGAVDSVDITIAVDDDAPTWAGSLAPGDFVRDGREKFADYALFVELTVGTHDVGVCFDQSGARAAKAACVAFTITVFADPSGTGVRPGPPGG